MFHKALVLDDPKALVITVSAIAEVESPEHYGKAMGTNREFAQAVRDVIRRAEKPWGWCDVDVSVRLPDGREGISSLGACSYLSAADFVENSGYFSDKVEDALQEALNKPSSRAKSFVRG